LVRHTAVGVNFIDTYHRSGLYPLALPSRLGQEAVGVVERLGAAVSEFRVGDRVAYAGRLGAYAERHVIPAERAVPLPTDAGLDDVTVAAALLKGMTAECLIRRAYPVAGGQWVLWHAAAGGTGLLACQWLAALGAKVIGTVGSDAKAELARAHGCREVIVYTRENFVERVHELTQDAGVPVVFDSVGASTFAGSLDCLSSRGTLVSFGNASGKASLPDVTRLAKGSLYLTRPVLFDYTRTRSELVASAAALFEVLRSGAVKPIVGQTFPLSEVAEAHRALEARATIGSTVLVPVPS
jgi:NADPH2:quinone reductase